MYLKYAEALSVIQDSAGWIESAAVGLPVVTLRLLEVGSVAFMTGVGILYIAGNSSKLIGVN